MTLSYTNLQRRTRPSAVGSFDCNKTVLLHFQSCSIAIQPILKSSKGAGSRTIERNLSFYSKQYFGSSGALQTSSTIDSLNVSQRQFVEVDFVRQEMTAQVPHPSLATSCSVQAETWSEWENRKFLLNSGNGSPLTIWAAAKLLSFQQKCCDTCSVYLVRSLRFKCVFCFYFCTQNVPTILSEELIGFSASQVMFFRDKMPD